MAFELWDDEYGNAIDDFESEEKALTFVRETVEACGPAAVARWHMDAAAAARPIRGAELLQRAMKVTA